MKRTNMTVIVTVLNNMTFSARKCCNVSLFSQQNGKNIILFIDNNHICMFLLALPFLQPRCPTAATLATDI
ncbi:hypothetical protein XELAEV_18017221mg [Xenopus laevis]|uniref:Uncharacterized protein n=1 Tax=Xenopus laevis TaxID=8355 RepID=A0A974HS79_XENLA|nr:hypothetical protein XELAEV_18017221mg [Xenopus laevis]